MAQPIIVRLSAEEEFPDLRNYNNHMAKVLTFAMYKRLRSRMTPGGFTLDDVIQTGVDNPGKDPHARFSMTSKFTRDLHREVAILDEIHI